MRLFLVVACSSHNDEWGYGDEFEYIDPYYPTAETVGSLSEAQKKAREIAKIYDSETLIVILSAAIGEKVKCLEGHTAEEWL